MIIPDTNILIYAYNSQSHHQAEASRWWAEALSSTEQIGLCSVVLFGFVRLSTNPRLFANALPINEAVAHANSWLNSDNVQLLECNKDDARQALAFLSGAGASGNLTTDAQIAAVAYRHHGVIHSADADFARFPGVRWHNPLAAKSRRR